jgi:hypothetical protein
MKLWRGEDFYLQIDSHHRFTQDWDAKLINLITSANSQKPIITTYCPHYTLGSNPSYGQEPTRIDFHAFAPDGLPLLKPALIPDRVQLGRLLRARFISAGFLFTLGTFVEEVPYDPNLYFNGEEISIAVRSYTWGYDLFHPPEVLGWHYYARRDQPKHWQDHENLPDTDLPWRERDRVSRESVRKLLLDSYSGQFGCGPVRSVAEYQEYAGMSFRYMKVQDYTRLGAEPPNPREEEAWHERIQPWLITIKLEHGSFSKHMSVSSGTYYIDIYDSTGNRLFGQSLDGEAIRAMASSDPEVILIQIEFSSGGHPYAWVFYSFKQPDGLLRKAKGRFTTVALAKGDSAGVLHGYTT